MNWQDINYWNQKSYGNAVRIRRSTILLFTTVLCLVTPGTNWFLVFLPRLIKKDIKWRY